ncbi:UPF0488 protein CG14286 [Leguminivora glycinivorella]|uniref:UPF0488 protein CG14286 n=1 Tax=Leguminivora glycinivorella TaxID=1035111 RepID=UPI00200CD697|nr:UPF0488 protein CG14286 [Leguminivora glycinivorella]
MPKPTKLHAKKKPTSIQKSVNVDNDNSAGADPEESLRQFQLELCWCIQQLEKTLAENKGNEKQLTEAWKVVNVLKNNSQPIIRKRQLMRTHFGDYRAKMAAEEKKLAKMTSKIKISDTPTQPKATFLRKSAFLTTGDSSFRFNFNLALDQVDTGTTVDGSTLQENPPIDNKNNDTSIKNDSNSQENKNFKFTFSDSEFKFNFNVKNS